MNVVPRLDRLFTNYRMEPGQEVLIPVATVMPHRSSDQVPVAMHMLFNIVMESRIRAKPRFESE